MKHLFKRTTIVLIFLLMWAELHYRGELDNSILVLVLYGIYKLIID